jgi:hypothetical protein
MNKIRKIYSVLSIGILYCASAYAVNDTLVALNSLILSKSSDMAWVDSVLQKSDELITDVHHGKLEGITSRNLLELGNFIDEFSCRGFSLIKYDGPEQIRKVKSEMRKRSRIFWLLAKQQAQQSDDSVVFSSTSQILHSLSEEDGISEEDIASDSDSISSDSSSPRSESSDPDL